MTTGLNMDIRDIDGPHKTAVISSELARLNVDIAALQETRLADYGSLREKDYTFFWQGKSEEDHREQGVGFAITCNKQRLNIALPPSLLKVWDLVLNYKCPNKCVFYCFYGFICDFHEFPSLKSSKIFTSHRFQRDTNFKHEKSRACKGSFFDIFKFMSFTAAKNLVL